MTIYFIRHGETLYNRRHIHQGFDVPLSEKGRTQVELTAECLTKLPITKLFTSDLVRTKESADIIAERVQLDPEENMLFREVRRPSELFDTKYFGVTTFQVGIPMILHLHDPSWHYSDEENLYDLKDRVKEAVAYLTEVGKEHEHVAVVSHALIIQIFIKYMCMYEDVRIRDYLATLVNAKKLGNASITTIEFNDDNNPQTCDWICTDFNNKDHLRDFRQSLT